MSHYFKRLMIEAHKDVAPVLEEFPEFLAFFGLGLSKAPVVVNVNTIMSLYVGYQESYPMRWYNPSLLRLFINGQCVPNPKKMTKPYKYALILMFYLECRDKKIGIFK